MKIRTVASKKNLLKSRLKIRALEILQARIEVLDQAMASAQVSANQEEKSSAGDKYETSRAMAQNDRDIYARQLQSAKIEMAGINQIDVIEIHATAQPGSLIETDGGSYFLLCGLGTIRFEQSEYFFISPASPIGKLLVGKSAGDAVELNRKHISVISVS